jgi:hypothetical protein
MFVTDFIILKGDAFWQCNRVPSSVMLVEITIQFNMNGSVHRNNILIQKSPQDAHVTEFILSDDCSTCFGDYYHLSSGAQNNCNYSIW